MGPVFISFLYFKNIEKVFACWHLIYKRKNSLKLFFDKKNRGDLMERLSFFGVSVLFFISLFSEIVVPMKRCEDNQNYSFIFIVFHTIYSFQKNWNQEILQNIDFFQKVLGLKLFRSSDNTEKESLVKLIDLFSSPFSYILGTDIKSLQNKILCSNLNRTGFGIFDVILKEKSLINVFQNSIKISLFMDIGFYLKLLFTKKKILTFFLKKGFQTYVFIITFFPKP